MATALASLLTAQRDMRDVIDAAVRRGLAALEAPPPMRLSDWAERHYYLSRESSYGEGDWRCWPWQRAILDCMGHDDIVSVTMRKPSRVGYSKMMLAAVAYFAERKRRNQIVYQPTDDDAQDWVTTDLDPMLRDVSVMASVFPTFLRRSKGNTLKTKSLLGCKIKIRGGTAAKNYRRLTGDVVYLDELDAFDRDVEAEGPPTKLSFKRLEGSIFPKHIKGSTPKTRGASLIDEEHDASELQFRFEIPCPHCGHEQTLEWGGKDKAYGFKWQADDADSVVHMCAACGVGFSQAQYLSVWERGRWRTSGGDWIDSECRFRRPDGTECPPPASVGFSLWSAYSPQTTWAAIVAEFLAAWLARKKGDDSALKAWTNTTKGESYKREGASTSAEVLRQRAQSEAYRLRLVPMRGLLLAAGVDVQDNRFHCLVYARGRDAETWLVDRRVIYCDPGDWRSWSLLDTYLGTRFPHEGGQTVAIDSVAIDTGGHYTHEVYRYCMAREARRVHATKGSSAEGRSIVAGTPTRQDVNVDGQVVKSGVKLWHVGTDTAKDLLHSKLRIAHPGPGYWHFSRELEADFFDQLTAEQRLEQKTARGFVFRWIKPSPHTRNEDLDATVLAEFCFARLKVDQYTDAEWRRLEMVLCPPTADLFAPGSIEPLPLADAIVVDHPAQADAAGTASQPTAETADAAAELPPPIPAPSPLWATPRGRRVRGAAA